ncbi:hypothetical protein B0H11DRAFT_1945765 [Mycena galericulata]|nr:hypothetical protein B0H11DRAFT_1945765 [Mycena galericulata]
MPETPQARKERARSLRRLILIIFHLAKDARAVFRIPNFYQEESKKARIVEVYSESSEDEAAPESESEANIESGSEADEKVYLMVPRRRRGNGTPIVQAADRTVPSTRTARKEVLDGVYPPPRDKGKGLPIKDLQSSPDPTRTQSGNQPALTPVKSAAKPKTAVPELTPVDARKVRFDIPEAPDTDMDDSRKSRAVDKNSGKKVAEQRPKEDKEERKIGRQSAISGTVNKRNLTERILDLDTLVEEAAYNNESERSRDKLRRSERLETEISFEKEIQGLITVAEGWIMTRLNDSIQRSHTAKRDKRGDEEKEEWRDEPVTITPESKPYSSDMSSASSFPNSSFETVQYLSRNHYHRPGPPDARLGGDSPDAAIQRAKRPLDVHPAFSASPQSFYLGSSTREDGQVVHDMVNLNSIQVLYNPEDGRPFTLTGHLYSHLLQSPSATSVVWPLEIPYPSDTRIRAITANNDSRYAPYPTAPANDAAAAPRSVPQSRTSPSTVHPQDILLTQREATRDVDESAIRAGDVGYSVDFGHVVADSPRSTPESLPALSPASNSEEDDFEYQPVETYNESEVSDSGTPFVATHPAAASSQPENTPTIAHPVPLPAVAQPTAQTLHESIVVNNLRQILGVETSDEVHNLTQLRDLARMAADQASTAYEMFVAQIEEKRAELAAQSQAQNKPECVAQPALSQMMTEAIITHREPFSLLKGVGSSRAVAEEEEETESSSSEEIGVDPLVFGRPGSALGPITEPSESEIRDGETITTNLASLSTTSLGYSPLDSLLLSPRTDRSVESDNDFVDPQALIDDALHRIAAGSPTKRVVHPDSPPTPPSPPSSDPSAAASPTDDADSISSIDSNDFLANAAQITGFPPIFQFNDGSDGTVGDEIFQWVEHQMEREEFSRNWDSEHIRESFNNARYTAYSILGELLDVDLMARENMERYKKNVEQFTTLARARAAHNAQPDTVALDTLPDPPQSSTSLDVSLQAPAEQVPSPPTSETELVDDHDVDDSNQTGKRKAASSRSSSSDAPPRKRFRKFRGDSLWRNVVHQEAFKAAHLLNPQVLGALSFVRRNIVDGITRTQDILVRERCDFRPARERYFSENEWVVDIRARPPRFAGSRRSIHPFLFDAEAAKLEVEYNALYDRHYYDLTWLVNDLLRIRFQDPYPIGLLLNAGFLDFYHPATDAADFWDRFGGSSGSSHSPDAESVPDAVDHANHASDMDTDSEDAHRDKRLALSLDDDAPPFAAAHDAHDTNESTGEMETDTPAQRPLFRVPDSVFHRRVSRAETVAAN